jgi:hypothetical protein
LKVEIYLIAQKVPNMIPFRKETKISYICLFSMQWSHGEEEERREQKSKVERIQMISKR